MKADLYSDIHLEFMGPEFMPNSGNILFLAGDIMTARNLNKDESSPKRQRYREFLIRCSRNYDHVFYVAGNHEHYGYDIARSELAIRAFVPENVHFLNNNDYIIGDYVVLGTTLWTDLKNNDPLVKWDVERYMNDFRVIRNNDRRFTPDRWWEEHFRSFQWLDKKLEEYNDKKVIVMTHHAPSIRSIHERYLHSRSFNTNYGYFSELDEYVEAHPQIKYWFHGHVHNSNDYMIGTTRVISNPHGYPDTDDQNPEFKFDLNLNLL